MLGTSKEGKKAFRPAPVDTIGYGVNETNRVGPSSSTKFHYRLVKMSKCVDATGPSQLGLGTSRQDRRSASQAGGIRRLVRSK